MFHRFAAAVILFMPLGTLVATSAAGETCLPEIPSTAEQVSPETVFARLVQGPSAANAASPGTAPIPSFVQLPPERGAIRTTSGTATRPPSVKPLPKLDRFRRLERIPAYTPKQAVRRAGHDARPGPRQLAVDAPPLSQPLSIQMLTPAGPLRVAQQDDDRSLEELVEEVLQDLAAPQQPESPPAETPPAETPPAEDAPAETPPADTLPAEDAPPTQPQEDMESMSPDLDAAEPAPQLPAEPAPPADTSPFSDEISELLDSIPAEPAPPAMDPPATEPPATQPPAAATEPPLAQPPTAEPARTEPPPLAPPGVVRPEVERPDVVPPEVEPSQPRLEFDFPPGADDRPATPETQPGIDALDLDGLGVEEAELPPFEDQLDMPGDVGPPAVPARPRRRAAPSYPPTVSDRVFQEHPRRHPQTLPSCDRCRQPGCFGRCCQRQWDGHQQTNGCTDDSYTGSHGDREPWSFWTSLTHQPDSPFHIGGWSAAGYHSRANGLFNDHPHRFNLNQQWLYAERVAQPTDHGWDWGFRVDTMYGVDAADTQSFGNTPGRFDFMNGFDHGIYGWAIPQAYGELAGPNMSVIVGHFYTLVGYETVTAPDNFFYSHAITFYNTEPFTHTGVLATYSGIENTELYFGWTLGWDTGFDQFFGGSNFLGGFSTPLTQKLNVTYITTAGDFGKRGEGYGHSIVFDWALSDDWNYVLQSDLLQTSAGEDNLSVNQYLFRTLSDRIALGARCEWWKGDTLTEYAPFGSTLPSSDSLSYYEATLGLNYRPGGNPNLVFRPEMRLDWSPALDYSKGTFGIDFVLTY